MDNVYVFALYGVAILGAVVLGLAAYAVLTRWLSERRQTRASRLQPRMQEAVVGYLAGAVPVEEAQRALAVDRRLGTGVLLGLASTNARDVQLRLRPLADALAFEGERQHALASRNPNLRARAAVQLGYLGSEESIPALLSALHDEQLDVRLAAAQALVQMRHAPAVIPILDALALPGRWPLQRATELIHGMGEAAALPLRQLLSDRASAPAPAAVAIAINVLGMLGAREAAAQVAGWLDHEDIEIRVAAAKALGGMHEPAVAARMIEALADPAWEVRSMAAKSLGRLRAKDAIPALQHALTDAAWWVRCNAAEALAEMGADGVAMLKQTLATEADAFARDISRQLLEERNLMPALEATS